MARGKLSSSDRREIVRLRAAGVSQVEIARMFSITERTVRAVEHGPAARKPSPRRRPKSSPAARVSLTQLVDVLDRAVELLEGTDHLLETGRPAAARAALGAVVAQLADVARDLELLDGRDTRIADVAFGAARVRTN